MSTFTFLITSEDIVWLDSYDAKKVNAIIKDVQRSYIKTMFPNYYDYLISAVENKTTKKPDDLVLDEYIKPMMGLLCENVLLIKSPLKISNVGARTEVSDNGYELVKNSTANTIRAENTQKAESYKRDLLIYMGARLGIFPGFAEDHKCNNPEDLEETVNISTVKGVYRQSSIYR